MKIFPFIRHTVVRLLICTVLPPGGGGGTAPIPNPSLPSTALRRDMSRALSTINVDNAAIDLLNYYLVHVLNVDAINEIDINYLDDDMESFLTGYSHYLCNTNIPVNHKRFIENPDLVPDRFMKYTGLKEYLGKAILLLRELCPNNEFWKDEAGLSNISGEKFKKACQRAQAKKDHNFGQESKVGLYRRARYGASETSLYPPHWTFLVNCDEICKQMLLKTFADDDDHRMTEKRLHLVLTKHGVGRGGEAMYLDWIHFNYNPWFDTVDGLWIEMKTLSSYMLSFLANKDGYATDVLHSMGSFFVVGKGLYRTPSNDGKMCTKVIPYLTEGMNAGAVTRFLTRAVRNNLHPDVPKEQQASISAVSLRIAGVTEMAAGNVGVHASHARSGHAIDSNQKHYQDNNDVSTSIAAAKCLAGWTDYYAPVSLPNLSCLGVSKEVINKLVDKLVAISLPDFMENGRLRPILLASIASLIMYDQDVIRDMGTIDNAISLTLRLAFNATNTIDPRAQSDDPVATLMLWGQIIKKNFHDINPDFQPLTDSSNSLQMINGINHIGSVYASLHQQNCEMRAQLTSMAASLERGRAETRQERRENEILRQNVASLTKQVSKLVSVFNPQVLPPSPSRGALDVSMMSSTNSTNRKRPHECNDAASAATSSVTQNDLATTTPAPSATAASSATASSATVIGAVAANTDERSGAAASTDDNANKRPNIAKNYNGHDADEQQGGTNLHSIIVQAYNDEHFEQEQEVLFIPEYIKRPARFKDKAKYEHCLALFKAVTSEEQIVQLMNPNLSKSQLYAVADEIADACLDRIVELTGRGDRGKMKKGYTGVGAKVQTLKSRFPTLTYQLPEGQQRLSFAGLR